MSFTPEFDPYRRAILKAATGMGISTGLALAGIDCGASNNSRNLSQNKAAASVNQYPELSHYSLKESNQIMLPDRSVYWLNYSGYHVNNSQLTQLYQTLDQINIQNVDRVSRNGMVTTFSILPRTDLKNATLYILGAGMPNAPWDATGSPSSTHAPTGRSMIRDEAILNSAEKAFYQSPLGKLNNELTTEACQQTKKVVFADGSYDPRLQEVICNALGDAIMLKSQGVTQYDTYVQRLKSLNGVNPQTGDAIPAYAFPEPVFTALPTLSPVGK